MRVLFVISASALLIAGCVNPRMAFAEPPRFTPRTDARGFIDVWQLRRDLAVAEAHYVESPDVAADACSMEYEGDSTLTDREAREAMQEGLRCEKRVEREQKIQRQYVDAFNRAWLPVLRRAVQLGDPIAEVILRDCDTTPLLDRSGLESTCDEGAKRDLAIARLRAIGFAPALPVEFVDWERAPHPEAARAENQRHALDAIRHGALGMDLSEIAVDDGEMINSGAPWSNNWAVIKTVLQDAPRAFTFGFNTEDGRTAANMTLGLNRRPLTLVFIDSNEDVFAGFDRWHGNPFTRWDQVSRRNIKASGSNVLAIQREVADTLTALNDSINNWLKRDPRWGVFLLQRVGDYEWVPQGMHSTTGNLALEWAGHWQMIAQTYDWDDPLLASRGEATIEHVGTSWQISETINHPQEPLPNVSHCDLRYSGASTFLPQPGRQTTAIGDSDIIDLGPGSGALHAKALAVLDTHTRYKQVLMQCESAESADSDRARYLLLAGNQLLEIGMVNAHRQKVAVRIYRRVERAKGDGGN